VPFPNPHPNPIGTSMVLKGLAAAELRLIEKKLKDVEVIFHTAGVNASNAQSNPEYALYLNGLKTLELVNSNLV
jgi:hypothetical protein